MPVILSILLALPATLLALIVLGICYQYIGAWIDTRTYPPQGTLVDVGGYRLHITSMGEGTPTVVLDSGLGHTSLVWSLVQPEVATFTRVCSYDRAGYGWSDAGPVPRTSQQIVKELHTVLHTANIPGPYVLVGHSFGGLNMYVYAIEYPEEVAGLVLIDAVSKDVQTGNAEEFHWFIVINRIKFRLQAFINRLGLFRLFILLRGPYAAMTFVQQLPETAQRPLLSSFMRQTFQAAALESISMQEGVRLVNATKREGTPLTIPLTVIAHGIPDMFSGRMSEREVQIAEHHWQKLQAALATLSTQGTFIVAEKSGHKVHIDQPELVIDAIRRICEHITPNTRI